MQVRFGGFQNCFLGFFAGVGLGEGHNAENAFAGLESGIQIRLLAERFNINGTLLGGDLEFAAVLDAAADVGAQAFFKHVAVESLEHQFAEFQ